MNLIFRTLSWSAYHPSPSKLRIQKWAVPQQICLYAAATVTGKFSGGERKFGAKAPAKSPAIAPKKIEYRREISNWINLTGFVDQPVQFVACTDGKFWAGTVISQRSGIKSSSTLWIPIIFEGDLAKIAAQHVKKDDQIHIFGKLFIDSPPPNITYVQYNVQVMVQNLNFVLPEKQETVTKKQPARSKKVKFVDEETTNSWKSFLENPQEWLDHRGNKANNLVKPRHPDFKSKDGKLSLWLNKAPDWVLPNLEELQQVSLLREQSWKDLVQNPGNWVDNRPNKTNAKAPDFTHKEPKEALWMNDSPTWVLSKLPPLKKNQERRPVLADTTVSQLQLIQLKRDESWMGLAQNPDKWWDNRLDKRYAKGPDFKHKETGEALWMSNSPTWVQSKLPPLKKEQERPVMA